MEEVKKSKSKNKVASLLLALALILTCGVAGTIAQYQREFGGTATANVANFEVSAGTLNTTKDADFDLFANITDAKGVTENNAHVSDGKIAPGTKGYQDIKLTNNSDVTVDFTVGVDFDNDTGKVTGDEGVVPGSTDSDVNGKYIPLQFAAKVMSETDAAKTETYSGIAFEKADITKGPSDIVKNAVNTAINSDNTLAKKDDVGGVKTKVLRIYWQWEITDETSESTKTARNKLDTVIGSALAKGTSAQNVFKQPKVNVEVTFKQQD